MMVSNPSAHEPHPARGLRLVRTAGLLLGLALLGVGAAGQQSSPVDGGAAAAREGKESRMWMTVGTRRFAIVQADSPAARAFAAQLPLTLDMDDLSANEKKVQLPKALPADASRPGTIRNGDLMLWGTDTLVVFYKTFSSPYSYTRLGRIENPGALPQNPRTRQRKGLVGAPRRDSSMPTRGWAAMGRSRASCCASEASPRCTRPIRAASVER